LKGLAAHPIPFGYRLGLYAILFTMARPVTKNEPRSKASSFHVRRDEQNWRTELRKLSG
jgi:hypothetical protein